MLDKTEINRRAEFVQAPGKKTWHSTYRGERDCVDVRPGLGRIAKKRDKGNYGIMKNMLFYHNLFIVSKRHTILTL
jgi:hypothetical protein